MLKKKLILFLGLVVITGSACVTPTHASSASSVVLAHIQAAGSTGAKEEMVSIYNNTSTDINITGWCLKNKSNIAFACFDTDNPTLEYYLPAYSYAMVATESFLTSNSLSPQAATLIFTVTNQSSGSLVNSADTVLLVDIDNLIIDSHSWTVAIPTNKVINRIKSIATPYLYETIDSGLSWAIVPIATIPINEAEVREVPPTQTPEDDSDAPPDDDIPLEGPDTKPAPELVHPIISELLPDAEGSDTGNEFIELYNPSTVDIQLTDYTLHTGLSLEKVYSFPIGAVIKAKSYEFFTNDQIKFTLPNTSTILGLQYKGLFVGDTVTYEDPSTGESWSLLEGAWSYSNHVTPGSENRPSIQPLEDDTDDTSSSVKPCAVNQYRSPETNRCRLIATTAASTITACKVGQVRSPETNRCRTIVSTSTVTACKEGQERNPETNRCRNITQMIKTEYGVKGVSTQPSNTTWYLWLGIGGVVALILGYGIWEWREELKTLSATVQAKFARNKP